MGQLSGDLSLMPLSDLIIWLANRQMSGLLVAELGTLRKEFTIERGSVVRASSNEPREYFGQFLIHFGLVKEEQLQQAFETQQETRVRLGRILVMIDAVGEEQVVQVLRVKISETALDGLLWKSGRFFFVDQRPESNELEVPISVPLLDIHREGLARGDTWEKYNRLFPNPQHVLYLDESRAAKYLDQDELDERIIALARTTITIEALALELHATDYQVATRLLELHAGGLIFAREPSFTLPGAAVNPPQGRTYADLARKAIDSDAIAEALQHLEHGARQDPDDPAIGALKKEAEAKARVKVDRQLARHMVPALVVELSPQEKKRLTAKERYVLARIDGYRTVDAIIQLSPMHDIEALEILNKFQTQGLIKI